MASSFPEQIPTIVYLLQTLKANDPSRSRMLDIGKGMGKYGFLAHEYAGMDRRRAPDPSKTLADQSDWTVDAVEIQPNYMWPHIEQIYGTVYRGDITQIYSKLPNYDIVLMADVIEHLDRDAALRVVRHFLDAGSAIIVATPVRFFNQAAFDSEWEQHRSHWRPRDFAFAAWMEWETVGSGRIYLLANQAESLKFFGSRPYRRIRRLAKGFYDASR